jgi:hypothetical protein
MGLKCLCFSQTRNIHDRHHELRRFIEESLAGLLEFWICDECTTSDDPAFCPVTSYYSRFQSSRCNWQIYRPSTLTLAADPRIQVTLDFDALVAVSPSIVYFISLLTVFRTGMNI